MEIPTKGNRFMRLSKGLLSLICSFTAAAFLAIIGTVIMCQSSHSPITGGLSENYIAENGHATVNASYEKYVLKEYNGIIGVFFQNELLRTIDVPVSTLPRSEQDKLKNGIRINTAEELFLLEEAYTG